VLDDLARKWIDRLWRRMLRRVLACRFLLGLLVRIGMRRSFRVLVGLRIRWRILEVGFRFGPRVGARFFRFVFLATNSVFRYLWIVRLCIPGFCPCNHLILADGVGVPAGNDHTRENDAEKEC